MAPSNTFLAAGAALSFAASVAASNVVAFDFIKTRVNARDIPHLDARYPHLARRANTVQADITNELLLYLINVTVGTPPQPISLQLDTGSSDIWFPAVSANICQEEAVACSLGTYDFSASSTAIDIGPDEFEIQYVDGSSVQGDYILDTLNIGSTKLTNMTMAAATAASRGVGIMGIGFRAGESIAELTGQTYPDVINVLKNEGKTSSLAYSLWLDDVNANTGSILFGGVDTSKYTGDLIALPIQNDAQTGTLTSFTVAWTGLTSTGSGKTVTYTSSNAAVPAILDSGTTDM
jgi:Eukaryotic aspartyl protease